MRLALFFALLLLPRFCLAQSDAPGTNTPTISAPKPKPVKTSKSAQTAAQLQAALDQLTQSNRDLLDLLKKQQAVLEDMQFDRRLQSRQIQSLEERLGEAMEENKDLEKKVAKLEDEAAVRPVVTAAPMPTPNPAPATPLPVPVAPTVVTPPPAPESYLPPAGADNPPGGKSWHRLFVLKGNGGRQTDLFAIQGKVWRVFWHNQDPAGKNLANTSGLFINAFPKDDTIPQRVCGKVGSGGDGSTLQGPGNYYLKIEASGGLWELAVEDFY